MAFGKLLAVAWFAAVGCGVCGCAIFRDGDSSRDEEAPLVIENVSVPSGKSLNAAILSAAERRKWMTHVQSDGTVRCTIMQRSNMVVVNVVPTGDRTFSIRFVSSNVPVRKYNKWADNLAREIVYCASRSTAPAN